MRFLMRTWITDPRDSVALLLVGLGSSPGDGRQLDQRQQEGGAVRLLTTTANSAIIASDDHPRLLHTLQQLLPLVG